jgi:hypothetical protein
VLKGKRLNDAILIKEKSQTYGAENMGLQYILPTMAESQYSL